MKAVALALAVSGFTLFCTLQAAYWPLIMKPGTVLGWWQSAALAKSGFFLGLPALWLIVKSPFAGAAQSIFAWLTSLVWAAVIYFAVGALVRAFSSRRAQSAV